MTGTLNLAGLLELLGYTAGEHVQLANDGSGRFQAHVVAVQDVQDLVITEDAGNVWFGVNAVRPVTEGRPGADDVTRLAALYCDLDVKDRGCPSYEVAQDIITELSGMLGTRPSATVYTGHGLHPYWPIENGEIDHPAGHLWRSDARALLRRWGRLVANVAERFGASIDSVYDLPRVLRVPNSVNWKGDPIPVVCLPDTGAPVDVERILETLDEYGIPDRPEDHADPGAVVSAPAEWTYAELGCQYAPKVAQGWLTDDPADRHPWLVAQATRIAVMHRNGCFTEPARHMAGHYLVSRFLQLLARGGTAREPGPGEIADAFAWGQQRAAAMSDRQVAEELGGHQHRQLLEAPNGTVRELPMGVRPGPATEEPPGADVGVPTDSPAREDALTDAEPSRPGPVTVHDLFAEALRAERTAPAGSDGQGADPAALAGLPGGPVVAEERTPFDLEVEQAALRLWIADEARAAERQRKAGSITPPEIVPLTSFLAIEDDPLQYRVDGLLPIGGRVMVSAQFKAGKSTLVENLIRCLADGDAFLGSFEVAPPAGSIVLIDNELDERTLRRWLRRQGFVNPERVHVVSLRGKVATFDLTSDAIRKQWADRLKGIDCAVLIFDCLRPVLDALGLSEDKEAGQFLVAFDALLGEAGISEAAVVHHMGHGGERARGDSRLRDWPDVEWRLVRDVEAGEEDPNAPRYFSAFGRDVDLPEGLLEFEPVGKRLSYAEGSRRDAKEERKAERAPVSALPDLIGLLQSSERPVSVREIEGGLMERGHPRKAIRAAVKLGIELGNILTEPGPHRSLLHYLNPSDKASVPVCRSAPDNGGTPSVPVRQAPPFRGLAAHSARTEIDDLEKGRPGTLRLIHD